MPGLLHPDPHESAISHFEDMTRNAGRIQEHVLHSILSRNAHTEYLLRCGLAGRTDSASFRQHVPIVAHSDLQPYFERIADGDRSPILTAEPVQTLSLSSGTTSDGRQKYLVLYKEILEASLQVANISSAYRAREFPIRPGKRVLELVFCGKLSTTKGGLTLGTATTHLFRSEEFKLKLASAKIRACSPDAVINGSDNRQAMYCHLLCALLYCEDVEYVTSTFAYTIVEAFHTFELHWQGLCEDIRQGQLSAWITDPEIRSAVGKLMRPNPELANLLIQKRKGLDNWEGVMPEIWPNCKYVLSIMTGSMEPYVKKLQHYAGRLPLVSGDYGATESWIAVNASPRLDPTSVSFTVVPNVAYFEFIPLLSNSAESSSFREPDAVSLTEVKVGHQYELLMTTYGGLYRYRLGDVVKVTGFFNSSPQLDYVCRKNVLLTVHIDKNTEKDLHIVVEKAANESGAELVDFTSHSDLSSQPGHYVIFWELTSTSALDETALQKCATTMDLSFVEPGYTGSRKVNTIGPLELCVVRPGTFRFLLDRYLTKGAAITQYKTPRCIASPELHNILRSSVARKAFSSAYQQTL